MAMSTSASPADIVISRLGPGDADGFLCLLSVFAEAFEEAETYLGVRPTDRYRDQLLADDTFVALIAYAGDEAVGGLAAYELKKFEQERSEFYIYDLAVSETHRRRGVATALIDRLKTIAAERGGWVIFVQADRGDEPAIRLYSKLGKREEVLHFDIEPDSRS